jgi:glycosyltransferase involved in cell wall biosynthesis
MNVAIVHDWLTGMRGGERVLEIFCRLFPRADIFTLFHFPGSVSSLIESFPITTSYLQHCPFIRKHYRKFLPLFPSAIESFSLEGYDLIISTSHAVAKGAIPSNRAVSICYCHTPMRYVWDLYDVYFGNGNEPVLTRFIMPWIRDYLRWWDKDSSRRVDHFIANSRFVAQRIQALYERQSIVINPPVDTQFFIPNYQPPDDFYLMVTALAPYKMIDLAIDAFARLDKRLVIIGWGPQQEALARNLSPNIEMLGHRPDEVVRDYYQRCRALIFPGVEDFGITPLEAQACGRPVIAFAKGGVLESVIEGVSGHFFHAQTPEDLMSAILEFETMDFNPEILRQRALEHDYEIMVRQLRNFFEAVFTSKHWKFEFQQN